MFQQRGWTLVRVMHCWAARRHYYSWVLAMLISQHGQLLHTFPRTIFAVNNFTVGGYSCMPDKVPIDRRISYPLASNLYRVSPLCLSPCLCRSEACIVLFFGFTLTWLLLMHVLRRVASTDLQVTSWMICLACKDVNHMRLT